MLKHVSLKINFILVKAEVDSVLHVCLVVLVHPDQTIGYLVGWKVEWVVIVVGRVNFGGVCV